VITAGIPSEELRNLEAFSVDHRFQWIRFKWDCSNEFLRKAANSMKRVVILGRGASGKSTLAVLLGEITGLPVIELDRVFWRPGLVATPRDQWVVAQEKFVAEEGWIMDGDLGPHDAVEVRLRAADTIIFLDFSLVRCAWRTIRRSRERVDFWRWLVKYRRQSRPILMEAIAKHAANAELHVFRNPEALRPFVTKAAREARPP
jgi:adenylate kinase family enzyme